MAITRAQILAAAAGLLAEGGREAVSTRAVCAAAGIQAPTLYRLFGDKEGLLDAVASYGFEDYLADKQALVSHSEDPVADLRRAWDLHIDFGLSHPAFYSLMYGEARSGRQSTAGRTAIAMLHQLITRIGEAGLLRMSIERATRLVHLNGMGTILSLLALPPTERDPELPAIALEHVLRTIIKGGPPLPSGTVAGRAVALREVLRQYGTPSLSPNEGALLAEWLDRITNAT
ncbi:TetR/AcrR family transcriptional regulator [Nonomuraea sp. NPDC049709]|uniref:TetR/AcrR family transcriptional regulator n=1 Tax=Nonomuraea sp. NPDC049709 TaxID=3154736 RepID=UPI0034423F6F